MTFPGRSYRTSSAAGLVYKRRPAHASVPLRSLVCADCGKPLAKSHAAEYVNRCRRCAAALSLGGEQSR